MRFPGFFGTDKTIVAAYFNLELEHEELRLTKPDEAKKVYKRLRHLWETMPTTDQARLNRYYGFCAGELS